MITPEQARTEDMFHDSECRRWRRNGRTQLWKTRPDDYRTPIKWGLRSYDQLTPSVAHLLHVPGDPNFKCGHTVAFGTLSPTEGYKHTRDIRQTDIMACPHIIMVPEHYREDGTCRCDDSTHVEMAEWGYTWDAQTERWVAE